MFNKKTQDRQELNPRRGALETPALPLSYGPMLCFSVIVDKPGSVEWCYLSISNNFAFLHSFMIWSKLAPATVYPSSSYLPRLSMSKQIKFAISMFHLSPKIGIVWSLWHFRLPPEEIQHLWNASLYMVPGLSSLVLLVQHHHYYEMYYKQLALKINSFSWKGGFIWFYILSIYW